MRDRHTLPDKYWTDKATTALVGRTINRVQYMTKDNAAGTGWYKRPIFLVLDDG